MAIGLNKKMRNLRRKIKWALSSKGAFRAVTGKDEWDEIKWAFDVLSPTDKEHAAWLAGKLKLDKHKGKYLVAWFSVQGKARQDIAKKYGKEVKQITKKIAKKVGLKDDSDK